MNMEAEGPELGAETLDKVILPTETAKQCFETLILWLFLVFKARKAIGPTLLYKLSMSGSFS